MHNFTTAKHRTCLASPIFVADQNWEHKRNVSKTTLTSHCLQHLTSTDDGHFMLLTARDLEFCQWLATRKKEEGRE